MTPTALTAPKPTSTITTNHPPAPPPWGLNPHRICREESDTPHIAEHYGIDAWFCDPHSPWQRGQIENLNRQFRWWFPRGTRLDNVEPAHADTVARIINGQRRRSLDYQSPAALYTAATVQ